MAFGSPFQRLSGGPVTYYDSFSTTNLYVEHALGGNVNTITITNDGTSDVQVSYDGATLEGDIKKGESMTFNTISKSSVYIKSTSGSDAVRIWGW